MSGCYYNEHDPFAAAWLRELIAGGHIAPGVVDERDIQLVQPSDLAGFDQCHFFAGIGGWSLALRLAGWDDARPVWTGSCPCQPFSSAGKGAGFEDPRHLWPAWFRLIRECRPAVVFGEQVAASDGIAWFDHVANDLESACYAVGAADIPAAGVGAHHIRHRLWFVAHSSQERHTSETAIQGMEGARPSVHGVALPWGECEWVACDDGQARPTAAGVHPVADGIPPGLGRIVGYGNAIVPQVAAEFIAAYREAVSA